jgi:hypothetical protein
MESKQKIESNIITLRLTELKGYYAYLRVNVKLVHPPLELNTHSKK